MISTKKLIKLAKKWRRIAAANRKRISWPRQLANEGHFIVYTTDGGRFMIPLAFLKSEIFIELLKIAEEEFGLEQSGPITLPCDSNFMEYVLSMVKRGPIVNLEKALIMSLPSCRYSSFSQEDQEHISQQVLISSF
ncbi:auxin-responsive protein SAUR64-like [Amaranthus tricolor]|uniref:auxin-responsive protein SAUR64-like n=1 Tax=Amaranthus tricolor TaxID=29722 RepID=UPI00258DADD2|nr:auxin-responsive protein SAUR64-like [Amaranthus tricolor]